MNDRPPEAAARVRELVELRIHGVSGTPPASMLDSNFATRAAGDGTTGFYVPDPNAQLAGEGRGSRARWLEGYSWRGLTSGSPLQALWILLTPFALANTAAAMRPPSAAPERPSIVSILHAAVVRLFALTLTLTLVMAAYIASIDQVAWQCGNSATCVGAHTATKYLGWSGLDTPARRMALTLALPLAFLALLWYLARRAWKARAAVLAVVGRRPLEGLEAGGTRTALDDPGLWEDREPSEYLRHAHIAAALALLSLMTAVATSYLVEHHHGQLGAIAVAAGVLLGVATAAVVVGWRRRGRSALRLVSVAALVGSAATLAWVIVLLATDPHIAEQPAVALPGVETAVVTLFAVQLVLTGAVFLLGLAPRALNRARHAGLRGAGSGFVCGGALMVGAMFSAGLVLRVSDYLGQPVTALGQSKTPASVKLVVPNALVWAARGTVALAAAYAAVLAVIVAAFLAAGAVRSVPRVLRLARKFFTGEPGPTDAQAEVGARARQIRRAERRAALTDRAGPLLLGPALLALGIALGTTTIVVLIDTHHYRPAFDDHYSNWLARHSAAYGSWLITAFVVFALGIALRARRNEKLRRTVGILWDLTTFWPRHAHPLAPPCYNDEALPEFAYRTAWHVRALHRDVIVSAHSQGSIIASTVVLQLPADVRGHVALLTYGSPLHRLYAPWFPDFFDQRTFDEMRARLADRWNNLYRTTDPIGGDVPAAPAPANVCIAPATVIPPGDISYPAILVHSDYQSEPEYDQAIARLDTQLR